MTLEYCPYCGTKLKQTTYNRLWCPNCGIIEEGIESDDSKGEYIG